MVEVRAHRIRGNTSGTENPSWSKAKYAARGVHLDKDTAGRLLEGMGDHTLREMIVRIIL